jgi:hypothetical protein
MTQFNVSICVEHHRHLIREVSLLNSNLIREYWIAGKICKTTTSLQLVGIYSVTYTVNQINSSHFFPF